MEFGLTTLEDTLAIQKKVIDSVKEKVSEEEVEFPQLYLEFSGKIRKTKLKYRKKEEPELREMRDEDALLLAPFLSDAGPCVSLGFWLYHSQSVHLPFSTSISIPTSAALVTYPIQWPLANIHVLPSDHSPHQSLLWGSHFQPSGSGLRRMTRPLRLQGQVLKCFRCLLTA